MVWRHSLSCSVFGASCQAGWRRQYGEAVRIGLVCPYSLSVPGGVQSQVLGQARALRALGHHAQVLAPCDDAPPEPGVTALGRSVPVASNGSRAPLAPDPACARRTLAALRAEEFDIVHLHEPLCPGPTLVALVLADGPFVGTFHRAGASTFYRALRPALRHLSRRLSVRAAVSEDARATATSAIGGRYELAFNGIEVERFAKATPWPSEGPTVMFLGRHEQRKGLGVLLEAMGRLPSDVQLWVAGQGPETAELRAATAGDRRIEWLGQIDDAERAARLRAADVFCAPSLHGESFGVVLLEAMAASTAIVASDLPGYRNVARSGAEALLVPPGEPAALAAALARALTDASLADRLVAAGEARTMELSSERLAERYVELYERVLAARPD
jgi:phosphatidyl-myo-inositol alpha-mannosyltransferase